MVIKLNKEERARFNRAKKLGGKVISVRRSGHFGVKIGKIPGVKRSKPIVLNIQGDLNSVVKARRRIAGRKR
tara:strand:+ start:1553 stop:1768 length:216 start_codon:yes stop_codon:yes gene_type:complete